ncbi:hypothetical protein D3C71_1924150 [compost metagenome]
MCVPTQLSIDGGSKDCTGSVAMACARICTSVRSPCFFAKRSDTSSAAAPPQVGGQAIKRVITPGSSTVSFMTSSVVTILRNSASGLLAAWRLALARTAAKVSMRQP